MILPETNSRKIPLKMDGWKKQPWPLVEKLGLEIKKKTMLKQHSDGSVFCFVFFFGLTGLFRMFF